MKLTGKDLFVINKLFGFGRGVIYYKFRSQIYVATMRDAVNGLYVKGGVFGRPVSDYDIIKKIIPRDTPVRYVEKAFKKVVNRYYKTFNPEDDTVYVNEIFIDKETGVLLQRTESTVARDCTGSRYNINEPTIKIKL